MTQKHNNSNRNGLIFLPPIWYTYVINQCGFLMDFMAEDDVIESANHFRCIDRMIDPVKAALTEKLMKEPCLISKNSTSDSREDRFAVGEYEKLPNEVGGIVMIPY